MTHKESHTPIAEPIDRRNLVGHVGNRFYYRPDTPGLFWDVFDVEDGIEYKVPERKVPKLIMDSYRKEQVYFM